MPYWDTTSTAPEPPQFFRACAVQFDYSVRSAPNVVLPLVGYENHTSRLGPAPGGIEYNAANALLAYNLPVLSPPNGFAVGLDETCLPRPDKSASTVAPLVLNTQQGATFTIDFSKSKESRFCGFINTEILRIKLQGGGTVNTLVGTFIARKIFVEGDGGLIIAHARTVASDPAGGPWPGQKEEPWPYAAADTLSHLNRFSGTTANGYFKPLYNYDAYYTLDSSVRAPYRPMRPHEVDEKGDPVSYYAPQPAGAPVLFPVPTPSPVSYSDMKPSEWRGVIFHLEQIL
jgi:hypothetical protein